MIKGDQMRRFKNEIQYSKSRCCACVNNCRIRNVFKRLITLLSRLLSVPHFDKNIIISPHFNKDSQFMYNILSKQTLFSISFLQKSIKSIYVVNKIFQILEAKSYLNCFIRNCWCVFCNDYFIDQRSIYQRLFYLYFSTKKISAFTYILFSMPKPGDH